MSLQTQIKHLLFALEHLLKHVKGLGIIANKNYFVICFRLDAVQEPDPRVIRGQCAAITSENLPF